MRRRSAYKLDPSRKRKEIDGQQVIQQGELAKLVGNRAGVSHQNAFLVIKELPEIIKELVVKGYIVSIDNFGNFFVREIKVPSYSYKQKKSTGWKKSYSFAFKRAAVVGREINNIMLGREREEDESVD